MDFNLFWGYKWWKTVVLVGIGQSYQLLMISSRIGRRNELRKLAKIVVAEKIGWGNEIIAIKIGQGNEKVWKIVVAEEIGQVNEIILSKFGWGNELRKLRLG